MERESRDLDRMVSGLWDLVRLFLLRLGSLQILSWRQELLLEGLVWLVTFFFSLVMYECENCSERKPERVSRGFFPMELVNLACGSLPVSDYFTDI